FDVVSGQANTIAMTLSGIPNRILVLPASGSAIPKGNGGFDLIGIGAIKWIVEAMDADSNIILGAGAPTFTVSAPHGSFTVALTQPTATAPNTFYIQPPATYKSGSTSIDVQASYSGEADGCAQNGAVCDTGFTVDMQQLFAVASQTTIKILKLGSLTTLATLAPSTTVNAIAFDSSGNLYASTCGANCGGSGPDAILKYAAPFSGTPVSITNGIDHPEGILIGSNGELYVANAGTLDAPPGSDSIAIFSLPVTAASTATKTYTGTLGAPLALATDSQNDLFVSNLSGNSGNGTVVGFQSSHASGNAAAEYGPIVADIALAGSGVQSISLDSSANLYVANPSAHQVTEYFGYNVTSPGAAYTCNSIATCGDPHGLSNPTVFTACNNCGAGTFVPFAIASLPNDLSFGPCDQSGPGNFSDYCPFLVADNSTNNAVYWYNGFTQTSGGSLDQSIPTTSAPRTLSLDPSNNLYIGTASSVLEATAGPATFNPPQTVLSGFTSPVETALLP
ncbi:MAG: hypothetical protein JO199_02720, partial [Candidatus Eremiobacteraeota bacterium]|nr:hypothetical protein [Candidatus Eremiobacteraeota bacterium]